MQASYVQNKPAMSMKALRSRVDRLFNATHLAKDARQEMLPLDSAEGDAFENSSKSLAGFIDFLAAAMPHGDIYLFGGVLRDLALYGKRGFDSDIDIVVDGEWSGFVDYLESVGAGRNKFGGYRLAVGDWPIDVWNAEDTWAIREGFVAYDGVSSLIKTTVLNWDAILMNWRSRAFICDPSYLESLRERSIDVVLEQNPNPLGMAVRVLRHLSSKDARRIGRRAAEYLERCTRKYSLEQLVQAEVESYKNSVIEPALYSFFSLAAKSAMETVEERFCEAEGELRSHGSASLWRQMDLVLVGKKASGTISTQIVDQQ